MAPGTEQIAFELEGFRWPAPDRLEVTGRWFGVGGTRFVRPQLDVEVDGTSRRLVAVLDHKPWAAREGEDWIAAFAWRGGHDGVGAAELSVSPRVRIELPAPGGAAPPARRRAGKAAARPAAAAAGRPAPTRRRDPGTAGSAELLRLNQAVAAAREERDEAQAERDVQHARVEALEAELAEAHAAHERALAALAAERDAAEEARDAAVMEEAAARRAAQEAKREREQALRERTAARAAADQAVQARDVPEPPVHQPVEPTRPRLLYDPAERSALAVWSPRLAALAVVGAFLVALLAILGVL